jgi:hypothetical protein
VKEWVSTVPNWSRCYRRMNLRNAMRSILLHLRLRPTQGRSERSERLTDAIFTGRPSSLTREPGKPVHLWRVACSCGFDPAATTAWEATEIAKLHVRTILKAPEQITPGHSRSRWPARRRVAACKEYWRGLLRLLRRRQFIRVLRVIARDVQRCPDCSLWQNWQAVALSR